MLNKLKIRHMHSFGHTISLVLLCGIAFAAQAQSPAILISEILFNPKPGGADYVEIYNASQESVALSSLRLVKWDNGQLGKFYPIPDSSFLQPGNYAVFTTDAVNIRSNYTVPHPNRLVELSSLPSYNDASGTVIIATADSLVLDRFDYSASMHNPLIRDPEGVALERRSFAAETQNPSNWSSAASTIGFGTPTGPNSQSHEFLFLENDFNFEPELFSPDGDGYNDLLNIAYQLSNSGLSGSIAIYDSRGRLVRHLSRNDLLGTQGLLVWDGTNNAGVRCQQGNYIIVVELYNTDGLSQTLRKTVALTVRK